MCRADLDGHITTVILDNLQHTGVYVLALKTPDCVQISKRYMSRVDRSRRILITEYTGLLTCGLSQNTELPLADNVVRNYCCKHIHLLTL